MESDRDSNETIPLSNVSENAERNEEPTPIKSDQVAVDVAGNANGHESVDEKNIPYGEALSIILPSDLIDLPQSKVDEGPSNEKVVIGTDVPDGFNVYTNKKTLTQGMMDVALFSANISQLRSVLDHMHQYQDTSIFSVILVTMLIVSIILQIAVGLLLLLSTRYTVNNAEERRIAYRYGNYVVVGIFLVTVVNVFISAFGTTGDRGNFYEPPLKNSLGYATAVSNFNGT